VLDLSEAHKQIFLLQINELDELRQYSLHRTTIIQHQKDKWHDTFIKKEKLVNSNLVQYLLQTDIQKRTKKIQWKIQTLHRDFSPGNPNRENQHILY
jgi:hypothetical protein